MAKFDADTLCELRDIREVAIRTEKHPATAVIIWVVVADEEVFVRSVRGSKGRWSRDLATGGSAHVGVCPPPAGRSGAPGWRCRFHRTSQPRILAEVSAEPLRTVHRSRRGSADDTAAGAELTRSAKAPHCANGLRGDRKSAVRDHAAYRAH